MGCSASKDGTAIDTAAPRPHPVTQPSQTSTRAVLQKPNSHRASSMPAPAQAALQSRQNGAPGNYQPPPSFSGYSWPRTVQQGAVTISIWHHPMSSPTQGDFYCWTYVSQGLYKNNQPEVVFTVRQRPSESENDFPQAPLEWIKMVNAYAGSGLHLDLFEPYDIFFEDSVRIVVHRVTGLDSASKWSSMTNFGMLTHGIPIPINGIPAGVLPPNRHHVIAFTPNEATVAREFGRTRVIGQVGLAARWFPYPPYIDRDRGDCCTMADQTGSIRLNGLPMIGISRFSTMKMHNDIVFRIPKDKEREDAFRGVVRDSKLTDALGFESSLHPDADSGLVWKRGQTRPEAYGIDSNTMNCMNLAFFIFCPQQSKDCAIMVEDGYSLMLQDNTWKAIRSAIEAHQDIVIPLADNMRFRLEWTKTVYHNPVDGQDYVTPGGSWQTYHPTNPAPPSASHVKTDRIVLLREPGPGDISAAVLSTYIQQVHQVVERLIPLENPSGRNTPGKQLILEIELPQSQNWLKIVAYPSMDGLPLEQLGQAILGVSPPQVRTGVKFQIVESLWGYSSSPGQFS